MSRTAIRLGIVGVGKIVRDQHLPAVAANADYRLVAAASRNATVDGVANFPTIEEMLDACRDLDAVSLCMPPQFRYDAARTALEAGKHVFLEKPPGATVSEVEDLKALADARASRCLPAGIRAMRRPSRPRAPSSPRPRSGRRRSTGRKMCDAGIPTRTGSGSAGGFGVFDPGINALSIATHILPPMFVTVGHARFSRKSRRADCRADRLSGRRTALPVRGRSRLAPDRAAELGHRGRHRRARCCFPAAAPSSPIDGRVVHDEPEAEYPMLYRRFAEIVRAGIPMSTSRRCSMSPTPSCSADAMWSRRFSTEDLAVRSHATSPKNARGAAVVARQ